MLNNLINKINVKMKRWFVARSDTHALVSIKIHKKVTTFFCNFFHESLFVREKKLLAQHQINLFPIFLDVSS